MKVRLNVQVLPLDIPLVDATFGQSQPRKIRRMTLPVTENTPFKIVAALAQSRFFDNYAEAKLNDWQFKHFTTNDPVPYDIDLRDTVRDVFSPGSDYTIIVHQSPASRDVSCPPDSNIRIRPHIHRDRFESGRATPLNGDEVRAAKKRKIDSRTSVGSSQDVDPDEPLPSTEFDHAAQTHKTPVKLDADGFKIPPPLQRAMTSLVSTAVDVGRRSAVQSLSTEDPLPRSQPPSSDDQREAGLQLSDATSQEDTRKLPSTPIADPIASKIKWSHVDTNTIRQKLRHGVPIKSIPDAFNGRIPTNDVLQKASEIYKDLNAEKVDIAERERVAARIRIEEQTGQRSTSDDEPYTPHENELLLAARFEGVEMVRLAKKRFPRRDPEGLKKRVRNIWENEVRRARKAIEGEGGNITKIRMFELYDDDKRQRLTALRSQAKEDIEEFRSDRKAEAERAEAARTAAEAIRERTRQHESNVAHAAAFAHDLEQRTSQELAITDKRVAEDLANQRRYQQDHVKWESKFEKAKERGRKLPAEPKPPAASTHGIEIVSSQPSHSQTTPTPTQKQTKHQGKRKASPQRAAPAKVARIGNEKKISSTSIESSDDSGSHIYTEQKSQTETQTPAEIKTRHQKIPSAAKTKGQREARQQRPRTPGTKEPGTSEPPSSGTRAAVRKAQKTNSGSSAIESVQKASEQTQPHTSARATRNTPSMIKSKTSEIREGISPIFKSQTPFTPKGHTQLRLGCASRRGDVVPAKRPASDPQKKPVRVLDRVDIPPPVYDATGWPIFGASSQPNHSNPGKAPLRGKPDQVAVKEDKTQTTLPYKRDKGKGKAPSSSQPKTRTTSKTTQRNNGAEGSESKNSVSDVSSSDADNEDDIEEIDVIRPKAEPVDLRSTPERLLGLPAGVWQGMKERAYNLDEDLLDERDEVLDHGTLNKLSPAAQQLEGEWRQSIVDDAVPNDDGDQGTDCGPLEDDSTEERLRRIREDAARATAEHDALSRRRWAKTKQILAENEEREADARRPAPDFSKMVFRPTTVDDESADEEITRPNVNPLGYKHENNVASQQSSQPDILFSQYTTGQASGTASQSSSNYFRPPPSIVESSQRSIRTADLRPDFPSSGKVKSQTPTSSNRSRGSK